MKRVLIIEDEPVLRSSMARGIGKLAGVAVVDVGTVKGALDAIDQSPPQMIISDIDLPDRSGIELLGELGRRGLKVPIVFVSAYLKAYGSQIPPHANVDVREKPIQLEELRAIVQRRLGAGSRPMELAPFAVADYVQLSCLGRHSVVIEVDSPENRGRIVIETGTVWTAVDERGEGEQAFARLAFLKGAATRVSTLRGEAGIRTINGGWEGLLLEAARQHDEDSHAIALSERGEARAERDGDIDFNEAWLSGGEGGERHQPSPLPPSVGPSSRAGFVWSFEPMSSPPGSALPSSREGPERASEPAPSTTRSAAVDAPAKAAAEAAREPHGPPEPPEPEANEAFNAAWDAGIGALLKKDYREAYRAFSAAAELSPDDPKVATNLSRLRQLGYAEPAGEIQK